MAESNVNIMGIKGREAFPLVPICFLFQRFFSMKKLFFTLFCAFSALSATAQRDTLSLNRDWMFRPGKATPNVSLSEASEQHGWRKVHVPHDFQIEQPWVAPSADERADNSDAGANIKSRLSARGFKEMGEGWYVRSLVPHDSLRGRRLLLDFEGIMYVGDVYLNGQRIGGTDYGYVGFEIDVTRLLRFGQPNTLAVRAWTGEPKMSRWYTGGGLFRNVRLIATDAQAYFVRHPLHITTSQGSSVTTPSGAVADAQVFLSAEIRMAGKAAQAKLRVTLTDADGTVVKQEVFSPKRNRNYRTQELRLPVMSLPKARLWDCEHPHLYTARVELLREDGTVADAVTRTFGVRSVQITPDKGLLLNGRKVLLKGYANHHTLGALGAAAFPRAIEKRLQLIRQFGMNHIRTSHNPYSEQFLDLCDRYGILVVDELYDKWNDQYAGAGRRSFQHLWQDDLTEWVRRDRCHPCVVMWSLGNELQQCNDMPHNDFGVTQYELMKTLVLRNDSTRKVTVAMHPRYRNWETDSLPCDLAMRTDVQSYNYRYMYFPGDGRRFPWMSFYQSEASVAAMGENYFAMDLDRVIGLAYWGAIDYLGESQGWPAKGWAQGVFDIALEPKPKAYYMKSFFSEEPLVHIAVTESKGNVMWNGVQTGNDGQSDHWNRTPGQLLEMTCYTNADEVELFVNGKSYGVKRNDRKNAKMRNQLRWKDVEYQPGYVLAVARTAGKEVARHRVETTGKAVALRIEADNASWKADGEDLQHLRIVAVDSKGRRVPNATGEVTVTLAGADKKSKVPLSASLVAVSSGNHNSDELNVTDHRTLFNGGILAILRAGTQAESIVVTATCPGLKTVRKTFSLTY